MNLSEKVMARIEQSPVWEAETERLNEIVEQANDQGVKLPAEVIEIMQENRILNTIYHDPEVKELLAEHVYARIKQSG